MNRPHRVPRRPLAAALLLAVAATTALAADPEPAPGRNPPLDDGQFAISVDGRQLGVERFTFRVLADSLCLSSQSLMLQPGDGRPDTVDKRVFVAVGKDDYLLHVYQSNEMFRGKVLVRGIVLGDTLFTLYREFDGSGSGDRMVLPPGRMYVMDSRLFSLVELITLSLHGQTFDRRPLTVLTLGDRDTVVEATIARAGRDTLRLGGVATPTTRWQLIQGPVTLQLWTDAAGHLMRVAHPPTGLLVERRPVAVKPRVSKPPAKHGG